MELARNYRRIAVEEAFLPPELAELYLRILGEGTIDDPGFRSLWGFYGGDTGARTTGVLGRIQDLDAQRIADMDATGIDLQILSLTCPGVQIFDASTACMLARSSNDLLAEAIRRHPTRFAGLAAIAPQDPAEAARELARGVQRLGLKGAIINSHTHDEYLDERRSWEIFEAAESLDVPIYLHPNTPSRRLIGPLLDAGLEGAIFGFGVETGLHLLRLITSGVFDRFPSLQIYDVDDMTPRFFSNNYGGLNVGSPKMMAQNCDVIITALPSAAALREVCFGWEGLATGFFSKGRCAMPASGATDVPFSFGAAFPT